MQIQNEKISLANNIEEIDSIIDNRGTKFQVVGVKKLNGAYNGKLAESIFFAEQAGLKAKMVRIILNETGVRTQAGALYYQIGNISCEAKLGGVTGMVRQAFSGSVTNESMVKPLYKGNGEIWLEPSFKHYIFMSLENEEIIVDKGMFFCCSEGVSVRAVSQKNISSAVLGGEGLFQIGLKGTGVVVLESTVPQSEIVKYHITKNRVLKVDGNFAIARTEGVNFTVTKSDKSLLGTVVNGEGLLNTFSGEGYVWLAPTAPLYKNMNLLGVSITGNSSNNKK